MTMIPLFTLDSILNRWINTKAIPIKIPMVDNTIGGLLPSVIHSISGDSGVGKTIFCIRAMNCLFQQKNEARVLYSEMNGNLRLSTMKKFITEKKLVNQIDFFKPKSLTEQIIFFRTLTEEQEFHYNLIIIDTLFGSPLDASRYLIKEQRIWKKRIFSHLLDLKHIAEKWEVPILITNHTICASNEKNPEGSEGQLGEDILSPLVPISMIIRKQKMKHVLEFRLFHNLVKSSEFTLILDE